MDENFREVIIIGGGISGLTVAWHLKKAGVDVCLVESNADVGGCTRTECREGFVLEKGPFNVMVRDPAFEALLEDVSKDVEVVGASPSARNRFIYRKGRLHRVPSNPLALATTGLLGVGARLRLLRGLLISARGGVSEETIEKVATRRFGREASDSMVSAAISGIFAGDIRRLSLRACFPAVAEIDAIARSLIGYGVRRAFSAMGKKTRRRRWRGLVSIDGGLGALTAVLGRALGADLLISCQAEAVSQTRHGYEVRIRKGGDSTQTLRCRRLVMASSARETSTLLGPFLPDAATILSSIESASLVVLSLGFRRSDVGHPLNGFGFLVPHNESDFPLMGVLWADSIFPHHAPQGHRLIRVFIGGAHSPEAVNRTDDELVATAMSEMRSLLQVTGDPVLIDVCRYKSAIPQYYFGHREKIDHLKAAVAAQPGLHLVGNYLEGVSLNDCVRLATNVAQDIIQTSRGARPARSPEPSYTDRAPVNRLAGGPSPVAG